MEITDLLEQRDSLTEGIREFCRLQKNSWQRVPLLALYANGMGGYNDMYSSAYHHGYWNINSSVTSGHYTVYVDLDSGELIDAGSVSGMAIMDHVLTPTGQMRLADAEDIVRLDFQDLDAQIVIDNLEARARKDVKKENKYLTSNKTPEELTAWHERIRVNLNLQKVYTRPAHST